MYVLVRSIVVTLVIFFVRSGSVSLVVVHRLLCCMNVRRQRGDRSREWRKRSDQITIRLRNLPSSLDHDQAKVAMELNTFESEHLVQFSLGSKDFAIVRTGGSKLSSSSTRARTARPNTSLEICRFAAIRASTKVDGAEIPMDGS